jgi:hypothetical protein
MSGTHRPASRTKIVLLLTAAGFLVAAFVGRAATSAGTAMCLGETGGDCHAFSRAMGLRMGLVTGAFAILMFLMVAGLTRMVALDEERRLAAGED